MRSAPVAWVMAGLIALSACASESRHTGAVGTTTAPVSPSTKANAPVSPSTQATEREVETLLGQIKADKKRLIETNMNLTDAEAAKFWPLYDSYQANLDLINKRLARGISRYAEALEAGPLSEGTAAQLLEESLAVDEAELALRQSHAEQLGRVLPATKVARYVQMENKIRAAVRYGLARGIPLAH